MSARWWERAACADLTPQESERLFFTARGRALVETRVICLRCPVKLDCLEEADAHEQGKQGGRDWTTGVRAALTPGERQNRRRRMAS